MFSYIWIIILVALWFLWTARAIAELFSGYNSFKQTKELDKKNDNRYNFTFADFWESYVPDLTKTYILIHIVIIFSFSFISWLGHVLFAK